MNEKDFIHKIKEDSKIFSEKMHDRVSDNAAEEVGNRTKNRRAEYIWAILANIVLLYVFNNLLEWNLPYLNSAFVSALAIFNVAFIATIFFNLILLAYDEKWFKAFLHVVLNVVGIIALYTLLITFPFDLADSAATIARIAIIAALVGTAIAAIAEGINNFFRR